MQPHEPVALSEKNAKPKMGIAGRLAANFQSNALTPLLAIVALLMGLFAVLDSVSRGQQRGCAEHGGPPG